MNPQAHIRSLPPVGAQASFGTAMQEWMSTHDHIRSLPPEGAQASFGTALQEAA